MTHSSNKLKGSKHADFQALCRKVGARFGSEVDPPGEAVWASGLAAVDRAAGGGMPRDTWSEIIEAVPSAGGGLLLHGMLETVRAVRSYAALVDGADGFAPEEATPELLRQLYWVRCRGVDEALRVTELLVADGNFNLLLLDLRGSDPKAFRRVPGRRWHRLQRMARKSRCTCVAFTVEPLLSAATLRLRLGRSLGLAVLEQGGVLSAEQIVVEPLRLGRRAAHG